MLRASVRIFLAIYVSSCYLEGVQPQQLDIAVGGNNNPNIIRRERYEYHGPFAPARHRRHREPGPFAGVLPGIAVAAASSWLQWWNEGRAVRESRMLSDAQKEVVALDVHAPLRPENEGKLVHVAGHVASEDGVFDADHGLFRPQALQLVRSTEAYQWSEERSERRTRLSHGETKVDVEYKYRLKWTSRPIDSADSRAVVIATPIPSLR